MIKCPECQKDVAESAKACPSCGFGVAEAVAKAKRDKENAEASAELVKLVNSPVALLIIWVLCFVLAAGGFRNYYETTNHPEKALAWHKAEMKKRLDELNQLRAKNGNLGSYSDYSAEYDLINRTNFSDMVNDDKNRAVRVCAGFGAAGVVALIRWRVVRKRLRKASQH